MKATATLTRNDATGDAPAPPLDIAIDVASDEWTGALDGLETVCERALKAAFARAGRGRRRPAEVSLVLADDAMVAELNRDYRGKDGPTNVLSFPQSEDGAGDGAASLAPPDLPELLGDVIVAYGVTAAESQAQGLALADHLSHLCVHGMLHLLGFDHVEDGEADRMERLETEILGGLGIPDPYGKER